MKYHVVKVTNLSYSPFTGKYQELPGTSVMSDSYYQKRLLSFNRLELIMSFENKKKALWFLSKVYPVWKEI